MQFTTAIITVSDRSSSGEREDLSGPAAVTALEGSPFVVVHRHVVADDITALRELLAAKIASDIALVLTTGGTGFAPRDVTPEATLSVIERRADGLTEAMRQASMSKTRNAMLSRAVCGIAGRTLVVNLPGAPAAVAECLAVILPVLPHALKILRGTAVPDEEHAAVPDPNG